MIITWNDMLIILINGLGVAAGLIIKDIVIELYKYIIRK